MVKMASPKANGNIMYYSMNSLGETEYAAVKIRKIGDLPHTKDNFQMIEEGIMY